MICSLLSICGVCLAVFFPLAILYIYKVNVTATKALPNPDELDYEQIFDTYGTIDVQKIEKSYFTEKNYNKFKLQFGALNAEVDLEKVGVYGYILTPFVQMLRRFGIVLVVTMLTDKPIVVGASLFLINSFAFVFEAHFLPNIEKIEQARSIVNEITILAVNYFYFMFTDFAPIEK